MRRITATNVHLFCRTCLKSLEEHFSTAESSTGKYDIHQTQDLQKWLETCTNLKAQQTDGLSAFVCKQCFNKLHSFFDFRLMCIRSIRLLSNLLATEALKKETNADENSLENFENADNSDWVEFDSLNKIKEEDEVAITGNITEQLLVTDCANETQLHLEKNKNQTNSLTENKVKKDIETQAPHALKLLDSKRNNDVDKCFRNSTNESSSSFEQEESTTQTDDSSDLYEPYTNKKNKTKAVTNKQSRRIACGRQLQETTSKTLHHKKYELKFSCDQCTHRFGTQQNLEAHIRRHQGLKAFQCPQCERGFNKNYHLRVHISEMHSNERKEIVCSFEGCNKVFKRDSTYRVHFRHKHGGVKPAEKTYVCEDCGLTYKNITMLRNHRYIHAPEENYPYQCEHCGKRFINHRTYKVHLMRHAGIKNFECPHCGMKKTTRNELTTHINYHTKERQWPCPLCKSVFNSSANLGMHDRIVHKGIRRFACRFCDQSFGKPDTLKHHEMRHTGEKPHVCSICQKSFIQPVALRTHMKTHKKDSKEPTKVETLSQHKAS